MSAALPEQPTPELPEAIGPGPSPFWPQHLVDLLFRPTRFFREQLALGKTPYVLLVTWCLGMSSAIDRLDTRIMQAELHDDPARWQGIESFAGSWPELWIFVGVGGVVGGLFAWYVGGWWCRVRLGWSGAEAPDPHRARLLLIYSSFVFAGPAVLSLVVQTLRYPSYLEAYDAEIVGSTLVLAMVFWSLFTTYKGAVALFDVSRVRARMWFVVLPGLFYLLFMGGIGALYAIAG